MVPVPVNAAVDSVPFLDIDTAIDPYIDGALKELDRTAPQLGGMVRYHLGSVDANFTPLPMGAMDRGKRFRPAVAMLACAAAGGRIERAAPLAAAIELLHNFTLIHDDIQDESPTRRHRPTVWSLWGAAQAINAGDAAFAAAHLALLELRSVGVDATTMLELTGAFERMTLAIVSGQVLDLSFETRGDVTPDDYLTMIRGKTAAIVEFAAFAGARLGGAGAATAVRFGEFGLELGLGFQIQDDLLGIWGATSETGKAAADDIRRRKKSLPILLLRQRAARNEIEELDRIYAAPEIESAGIDRVLALLDRHDVRTATELDVLRHHDAAATALQHAAAPSPARDLLITRIETLATRAG